MASNKPFSYREDWPIYTRWFWFNGQRMMKPEPFRGGRGSMYPTPGGRWKVRQLRSGKFLAYVDEGKSKMFKKRFSTTQEAINYSMAMAYIARHYAGRGKSGKWQVINRIDIQRQVCREEGPVTREFVDELIETLHQLQWESYQGNQ